MQCQSDPSAEDHEGAFRQAVASEISRLLDSVEKVDLGTVYRTVTALLGGQAAPHIAEAIGAGLRAGDLEMEVRCARQDEAVVAYVRRAARCRLAA